MSDLTIALPTFDRRAVLEHTIDCYLTLAARFPLLVIDDGSHDGTADWLRGLGLTVLRHPRRRGLPAARNTALRAAKTRWVLFGEDDVLFPADHPAALLTETQRLGARHPLGAVAGRLFAGDGWTIGARPTDSASTLLDERLWTADFAAALSQARPLPSLHACALVDRAAALAVGGYDESLTASAFREESDLYARLWHAGYSCWLTPATWAVHVRHRLGGGCRGRTGLGAKLVNRLSYWRNNARFADRHHRLWWRWCPQTAPARIKLRWAGRIAGQAWAAWGTR